MKPLDDPFREKRQNDGVLSCPFEGETVHMVLGHQAVREAAKDWETFSSDAPFRVPVPSEESMRTMRQLPIETNPPEHTEWRKMVEPFFKRAKNPEVIAKVDQLIRRLVEQACQADSVEVVRDFALPLQSHALTYLLNVDEKEAETWISWGIHVFHDGDSTEVKGAELERYLNRMFDQAEATPEGEDFFSALTRATFQGRALTRDEMLGFANLAFAGGRDTIIHTVSSTLAHLAAHPEALDFLREDPKRAVLASEEFFRVVTPLTHIGRVCPNDTEVGPKTVSADERISLCWASANLDETAFPDPLEVKLDRKPNPHMAFGVGTHFCLGAPHARLLLRTLLTALCDQVQSLAVTKEEPHVEVTPEYTRSVGYDALHLSFEGR